MTYVEKLQRILEMSGLTQSQLASRIGVTFASLNAWVNGRVSPRRKMQLVIDSVYAEFVDERLLDAQEFAGLIEQENGKTCLLTSQQVESLLEGLGDEDAIGVLRNCQHAKFLKRLAAIVDLLPQSTMVDSLSLLDVARRADAEKCKMALTYPTIAVWASAVLQALTECEVDSQIDAHVDYFNSIAAVVAWQCGVPNFSISVPVQDAGFVVLPGLGSVVLDDVTSKHVQLSCVDGELKLVTVSETVEIPADPRDSVSKWRPIAVISVEKAGLVLELTVDDIDPYRVHGATLNFQPHAPHLELVDVKGWESLIREAWEIIVGQHRDYAVSIARGLTVVVPISQSEFQRSAFQREGFGTLISTVGVSAGSMAHSMIEEFQRMKLNALHSLMKVHTAVEKEPSYYAPWSESPLSFQGLVEGFYSTAASAELWGRQIVSVESEEQVHAAVNFCLMQWWEENMYYFLTASDKLTQFGYKLVETIHRRIETIQTDVPDNVVQLVRLMAFDCRLSFRVRNLTPDADDIKALVRAWRAGLSVPVNRLIRLRIDVQAHDISGRKRRRKLSELRLVHPDSFAEAKINEAFLQILVPSASIADAYLVDQDFTEASQQYLDMIIENEQNIEAWTGLAVACVQSGNEAASTLGRFPEVLAALHRELRTTHNEIAKPLLLARWLEPLLFLMDDMKFDNV